MKLVNLVKLVNLGIRMKLVNIVIVAIIIIVYSHHVLDG